MPTARRTPETAKWKAGGRGRPPAFARAVTAAAPGAAQEAPSAPPAPTPPHPAAAAAQEPAAEPAAGDQAAGRPNPLRAAQDAPGAAAAAGGEGAGPAAAPEAKQADQVQLSQKQVDDLFMPPIAEATYVVLDVLATRSGRKAPTPQQVDEAKIPELTLRTVQAHWPGFTMDPKWLVTGVLALSVYRLVKNQPPLRDEDAAPIAPAQPARQVAGPAPAPQEPPPPPRERPRPAPPAARDDEDAGDEFGAIEID